MQSLQVMLYSNNAVSTSSNATSGNSNSSATVAWLQVTQDVYLQTTVAVNVEAAEETLVVSTTNAVAEAEGVVVAIAAIVMT
jgi:hypothetical protein